MSIGLLGVNHKCGGFQTTPLYQAAIEGHEDVVELLLDKGADPNKEDLDKWTPTPLCEAAMFGYNRVAQLLLNGGAEPNHQNVHGWSPLHLAAFNGQKYMAQLLLARGSLPNQNKKIQFILSSHHNYYQSTVIRFGAGTSM